MPKQMPLANGKKTAGRQCIEFRRIPNKDARQVAFFKRKAGIFKKAAEIAVQCRANLGIVIFTEHDNAYALGSPSADAVLGFGNAPLPAAAAAADDAEWESLEELFGKVREKAAEVTAETDRLSDIAKKIVEVQKQTGKRFWWEVDVEALGKAELPVFLTSLERMRNMVGRRVEKLNSTPPPPPPQ